MVVSHEDWEKARQARDRAATNATRALLAGKLEDAMKLAQQFAGHDATMAAIERQLDGGEA